VTAHVKFPSLSQNIVATCIEKLMLRPSLSQSKLLLSSPGEASMSARREGRAVGEVGPREIKGAGRNGSWAGLEVGSEKKEIK